MLVLVLTVKMTQIRTVMTKHDKLQCDDDDEDDSDDDAEDDADDDDHGVDEADKSNTQILNIVSRNSCFDHVSVLSSFYHGA